MFTLADFKAHQPLPPATMTVTGVSDLDGLTGGITEGAVWLISSAPRQGRTMIATQFARLAGENGIPVRFVLGDADAPEVIARIRAASTNADLSRSRTIPISASDAEWDRLPITFDPEVATTTVRALQSLPDEGMLVVDDADLWVQDPVTVLKSLRSWAQRPGRAVLVTLPIHLLDRDQPARWQEWTRTTDVIVELNLTDDDGLLLSVIHHRAGPTASIYTDAHFAKAVVRDPAG